MVVPKTVLLIDCETTGVDHASDKLCEIGAILFSVEHRAVIQQLSFLLPVDSNEAEAINKIPAELTSCSSLMQGHSAGTLLNMISVADALVAHNADFDQPWIDSFLASYGQPSTADQGKTWICTCHGISWPNVKRSPSLTSLALAYQIPVWAAHRALTDCIYLSQVFERDELLERHLEEGLLERVLVRACVLFDQKDLAREAGFRWDAGSKSWLRKCNASQIMDLPFSVVPVS